MRAINNVMDYETLKKANQAELARQYQAERQAEALEKIPARYQHATFENYVAELPEQQQTVKTIKKYTATFADRLNAATSLLLSGNPGTGKTHLSWCLYRQLIQFYRVKHTCLEKLVQKHEELKTVNQEKRIKNWTDPDLLIIDELQIDPSESAWKRAEIRKILFEIVNARYEALHRPLLLITNTQINELAPMFGEKTLDRILESGCSLTFNWSSYRTKKFLNKTQAN